MLQKELTNLCDPKFKHLVGKKIQFKDNNGKIIKGECNFIGHNKFLNIKNQITVNRTPFKNINFNTIKIIE